MKLSYAGWRRGAVTVTAGPPADGIGAVGSWLDISFSFGYVNYLEPSARHSAT